MRTWPSCRSRTAFLRQVRFGRDGAESTTKSYAHSIALFLRWCARTGRTWQAGAGAARVVHDLAARTPGRLASGPARPSPGVVLAGPGTTPARGARRVNGVLTAVRGMVVHAVAAGQASGDLVPLLYEVADDRDLPEAARGEDGRMAWRMRARHRLHEPETPVDRASDEEIVALLRACLSARDRLIVLLMARAGLRRGELCGLRRSRCAPAGRLAAAGVRGRPRAPACGPPRGQPERGLGQVTAAARRAAGLPHGAGVRHLRARADDGARPRPAATSCWSTCSASRSARRCAPDAIGELLAAAVAPGRAWHRPVTPHQLRHAFGSNARRRRVRHRRGR